MADVMQRAKARFRELDIKWTVLREQVLRHIATSHKPVSAYELIDSLAKEGKRLAPVSIYRILDVLQTAGLVHRLESRNAFFACMTNHQLMPQMIKFICDDCERVMEVDAPDAVRAISHTTEANHFHPRSMVIEVSGTCAECHEAAC